MKRRTIEILFVTYYWPPKGGPGVKRILKLTKYLSKMNVKVSILTVSLKTTYADRNYFLDPSLQEDIDKEIRVIRVHSYEPFSLKQFLHGKRLGIIYRWLHEPDPQIWWALSVINYLGKLKHNFSWDLVCTTSAPFSTMLIGYWMKKYFKIKWIADLRDSWIDGYHSWPSKIHYHLATRFEKKFLNVADVVIGVTPTQVFNLRQKYSNLNKVVLIPNGYDPDDIPKTKKLSTEFHEGIRIVYIGNFYRLCKEKPKKGFKAIVNNLSCTPNKLQWDTYSPRYLFAAVRELEKTGNMHKKTFQFEFAGGNRDHIEDLAKEFNMQNQVIHYGYLPHRKALSLAAKADLLFLPLPFPENNKKHFYCIPQKTYEYLALDRPLIAFVPPGDTRDLISKYGGIIIQQPWDIDEVKRSLAGFVARRSGSSIAHNNKMRDKDDLTNSMRRHFSYSNLARSLQNLIEEICNR